MMCVGGLFCIGLMALSVEDSGACLAVPFLGIM